ncbi:MAG: sugar-binding domain-containing protein [Candidatus Omnitrophota bacterium]
MLLLYGRKMMYRINILILMLVNLLMLISPVHRADAGLENIVKNSGFEEDELYLEKHKRQDGLPDYWYPMPSGMPKEALTIDVTSTTNRSGNSLKITGNPDAGWWGITSVQYPINAGETYVFGGDCRTSVTTGEVMLAVREIKGNGGSLRYQTLAIIPSSDWKSYRKEFKASEETAAAQFYIILKNVSGDVWCDNVFLRKGDEMSGNLSSPGYFVSWSREKGNLEEWKNPNEDLEFKSGNLSIKKDAISLYSPILNIDAEKAIRVELRFRTDRYARVAVFWGSETDKARFSEERVIKYPTIKDGFFHTYIFDMRKYPSWKGKVQYLRIDFYRPGEYTKTDIAFIGISSTPPSSQLNLISNPEFEYNDEKKGYPDGWSFEYTGKEVPGSGIDKAKDNSGASVYIEGKGNSTLACWASDPVDLSILGKHKLVVRYKTKGLDEAKDKVFVCFEYLDIDNNPIAKESFALPPENKEKWNVFETQISPPADSSTCVVKLSLMTLSGKVWFDEVTFTKVKSGEAWDANWIRYPIKDGRSTANFTSYFRKKIVLSKDVVYGKLEITGDDKYKLWINGEEVGEGMAWSTTDVYDIKRYLKEGNNIIAVELFNVGSAEGLLVEAKILGKGESVIIKSDNTWRAADKVDLGWKSFDYSDSNWVTAEVLGKPPISPWGEIIYYALSEKKQIELVDIEPFDEVQAGKMCVIKANFITKEKIDEDYFFSYTISKHGEDYIKRENISPAIPISQWPCDKNVAVGIELAISKYLPQGEYELKLDLSSSQLLPVEIINNRPYKITVKQTVLTEKKPKVSINSYKGTPRIFVDDKLLTSTVGIESAPYQDFVAFKNSGVDVYHITTVRLKIE